MNKFFNIFLTVNGLGLNIFDGSMKKICCLLLLVAAGFTSVSQNNKIKNLDLFQFTSLIQQPASQTTVINFWATWCKPCMEELHLFTELKKTHPEVHIVLVNLDFEKFVRQSLYPMLNDLKDCEVVRIHGLKDDEWIPIVDADWDGAIPVTIIKKGESKNFIQGKIENLDSLKKLIL